MGRKFIKVNEVIALQNQIDGIKSINSWTKKKYELRDDFFAFVKDNYKSDCYSPHATFTNNKGNRFYSWDYEIRITPNNQRGYLSKYRGKKLFIVCTYIYKYGCRDLLILPLRN